MARSNKKNPGRNYKHAPGSITNEETAASRRLAKQGGSWIGNYVADPAANAKKEFDPNFRGSRGGHEATNYASEAAGHAKGKVKHNDAAKMSVRHHASKHRSTAKVAAGGWNAIDFMDRKFQGVRYGNWADDMKKAGIDPNVSATRLISILQRMGMDTEGLDHKHGKKFREINGTERENWNKAHMNFPPGMQRILGKGLNPDGTLTKAAIDVLKQFHAAVRQNIADQNEIDGIFREYIKNQHGKRTRPDGTVTKYHTRPAGGLILGKKGH